MYGAQFWGSNIRVSSGCIIALKIPLGRTSAQLLKPPHNGHYQIMMWFRGAIAETQYMGCGQHKVTARTVGKANETLLC